MMTLPSLFHRTPSVSARAVFRVLVVCFAVIAVFWLCTYKIMDRDFWWHITAGNIMLQTHRLIQTDPFAYTRAGLPYLATHEWLAQIFLAIIYNITGANGIILFRGLIACTTAGLLLLLGPKRLLPNVLLAVWGVVITKGSYLERPQLFTFVLFAAFVLLAFRFLDATTVKTRLRICAAFIVLELLWVNMHGAAALVGCAIVSFVFLQIIADVRRRLTQKEQRQTILFLCGTLLLMSAVLVFPPNGFGTLDYLSRLLNDQTIQFIAEWQPRTWSLYLADLWPFWTLALIALVTGRRHWIFNTLLLVMTAYLSRQAFRHEILFVLAALATCFYQFDRSAFADSAWEWVAQRRRGAALLSLVAVLLLARIAYLRSVAFEWQDNLFGFGQFDLARGATDFVEREHITGNMFNTYGIGGYLIYRGYPDRKVFIDGRNVDYGFDFMAHTYAAGIDARRWKELEDTYNLSYALVDYDAIRLKDRLPYSGILEQEPDWSLVYLDDWVAVYLRNTPANQPIIQRWHYSVLTATDIQYHSGFEQTPANALPALVAELHHMQEDNPEGVKATLALATIALRQQHLADAIALATTAMHLRPFAPEPYAVLAAAYVAQKNWTLAAGAYHRLLARVGDAYPDINYAFIADVFRRAGEPWAAWFYGGGKTNTQTAPQTPASFSGSAVSTSSLAPSLAVNPEQDALDFNAQGLLQAEKNQTAAAEQSFQAAITLNPAFAEAWNNLCALYLSEEKNKEAIDACQHAISLRADYADAHFNLALAFFRTGSYDASEKEALLAKKLGRTTESDQLLHILQEKKG